MEIFYCSATELISGQRNDFDDKSFPLDQAPEMSLWERLGNAATLNIESGAITWSCLSSLHHTEHTSSNEHSEDELNKVLEVNCCTTLILVLTMLHLWYLHDQLKKCVLKQIEYRFIKLLLV